MPPESGPIASPVADAAARTVAAGTARLFAAWCPGSPLPEAADRRCAELWDFGVAADITPPGPDEVLTPREAYRLAEEEPPGPTPDPAGARTQERRQPPRPVTPTTQS